MHEKRHVETSINRKTLSLVTKQKKTSTKISTLVFNDPVENMYEDNQHESPSLSL